ncbi:MAG: choice-of-anchor D domain-containing protein [Chloroflexota bacterium]
MLRGSGQGPESALTSDRVNFGRVTRGAGSSRSVVITNTGLAPLRVQSIRVTGAAAADYSAAPYGPNTVASGTALSLTVTCSPTVVGQR